MANLLYQQHLISINDLSTAQLELLLHTALKLKRTPQSDKPIASCPFEPSTRTRLPFETGAENHCLHKVQRPVIRGAIYKAV